MNIAITGHASGIGKGVFEFYTNNCMGFDLTNGYNIEAMASKDDLYLAMSQTPENLFWRHRTHGY